jgi:hypothetical protein
MVQSPSTFATLQFVTPLLVLILCSLILANYGFNQFNSYKNQKSTPPKMSQHSSASSSSDKVQQATETSAITVELGEPPNG